MILRLRHLLRGYCGVAWSRSWELGDGTRALMAVCECGAESLWRRDG